MIHTISVTPFKHVHSQPINQAIDDLWYVVWDILGGEPSWFEHPDNHEAFYLSPNWYVTKENAYIEKITGHLSKEKYSLYFFSTYNNRNNMVKLISDELGCKYVFTSNPDYGLFASPRGSIRGYSYYMLKSEYQYYKADFLKFSFRGNQPHWFMSAEKEKEAVQFINRLCTAVKSYSKG